LQKRTLGPPLQIPHEVAPKSVVSSRILAPRPTHGGLVFFPGCPKRAGAYNLGITWNWSKQA